jgi:hypothetical protein
VDLAVEKAAKRLGITATQVIFLWVKAKGAASVIVTSVESFFFLFLIFYIEFSSILTWILLAQAPENNI